MAMAGILATQLTDHSARAYGLWLDGTDVIKEPAATKRYGVDISTVHLTVNGPGGVSTLSFTIDDPLKLVLVTDGQAVRFHDITNDQPMFTGWIEHFSVKPDFGNQGRSIQVSCVGPESLLDWYIMSFPLTFRSASLTNMIQAILGTATGIGELRALVHPYTDQGAQDRPIGNLTGIALAAVEQQRVDVEAGTAPWVAGPITGFANSATLSAVAGDAPPGGGANSVDVVCNGAASDQMAYVPLAGTFLNGVPYQVSFWWKAGGGSGLGQWLIGSNGTTADRAWSLGQPVFADWTRHTVTWVPTADRTDAVLAIATYGVWTLTMRVDLIQVVTGGVLTIGAGTTLRDAIKQAAAACVTDSWKGLNLTVDQTFGLRAWGVLSTPTVPLDVAAPIVVDSGGTNKATNLSYDVDASGIVRAVIVFSPTVGGFVISDGSGKRGRTAVIVDVNNMTTEGIVAQGLAYLNDYRGGLRGSLSLEDVASGPTAAIDALRLLTLTDPATGGSGTYTINSLEFSFFGSKRNVVVNFGGLPPSAAALIRRLTRTQLS
jgi:hypothetical protein